MYVHMYICNQYFPTNLWRQMALSCWCSCSRTGAWLSPASCPHIHPKSKSLSVFVIIPSRSPNTAHPLDIYPASLTSISTGNWTHSFSSSFPWLLFTPPKVRANQYPCPLPYPILGSLVSCLAEPLFCLCCRRTPYTIYSAPLRKKALQACSR